MQLLPTLFALWTAQASVPGFVLGEREATTEVVGSALVIAPSENEQRWTFAPKLITSGGRVALLVPFASDGERLPRQVATSVLRELDTFTAPRSEAIRCEDLAKRDYLYTAPGCRTTEADPLKGFEQPEATESYPSIGQVQDASFTFEWVTTREDPEALDSWLSLNGFEPLGAFAKAATDDYPTEWHAITASFATTNDAFWLPPLQVEVLDDELPLHLATSDAEVAQTQTIWRLAAPEIGPLAFAAPESRPASNCVLPSDAGPDWYAEWMGTQRPEPSAYVWTSEYFGPLDQCSRCTTNVLYSAALLELGSYVAPNQGWVSRVNLRAQPNLGALDLVQAAGAALGETTVTVFVDYDPAVAAYIPSCEDGNAVNLGSCPGLEQSAGCFTSRTPPFLVTALTLCALLFRSTRGFALVLLCWLPFAPTAHAGSRPVPRAEVAVGTNAWSTQRLDMEANDSSGAKPASVWSIDSQLAVVGWPKGALEVSLGWSIYNGRPGEYGTRFTLSEPQAGLSIRHGRYQDKLSPFWRYGVSLVHTTVDASVWEAHHTSSVRVHADGGVWFGRNGRRLTAFLRASTVPRTDAWVVRFHPSVGIQGWTFLPGYVSTSLHIGIAFP